MRPPASNTPPFQAHQGPPPKKDESGNATGDLDSKHVPSAASFKPDAADTEQDASLAQSFDPKLTQIAAQISKLSTDPKSWKRVFDAIRDAASEMNGTNDANATVVAWLGAELALKLPPDQHIRHTELIKKFLQHSAAASLDELPFKALVQGFLGGLKIHHQIDIDGQKLAGSFSATDKPTYKEWITAAHEQVKQHNSARDVIGAGVILSQAKRKGENASPSPAAQKMPIQDSAAHASQNKSSAPAGFSTSTTSPDNASASLTSASLLIREACKQAVEKLVDPEPPPKEKEQVQRRLAAQFGWGCRDHLVRELLSKQCDTATQERCTAIAIELLAEGHLEMADVDVFCESLLAHQAATAGDAQPQVRLLGAKLKKSGEAGLKQRLEQIIHATDGLKLNERSLLIAALDQGWNHPTSADAERHSAHVKEGRRLVELIREESDLRRDLQQGSLDAAWKKLTKYLQTSPAPDQAPAQAHINTLLERLKTTEQATKLLGQVPHDNEAVGQLSASLTQRINDLATLKKPSARAEQQQAGSAAGPTSQLQKAANGKADRHETKLSNVDAVMRHCGSWVFEEGATQVQKDLFSGFLQVLNPDSEDPVPAMMRVALNWGFAENDAQRTQLLEKLMQSTASQPLLRLRLLETLRLAIQGIPAAQRENQQNLITRQIISWCNSNNLDGDQTTALTSHIATLPKDQKKLIERAATQGRKYQENIKKAEQFKNSLATANTSAQLVACLFNGGKEAWERSPEEFKAQVSEPLKNRDTLTVEAFLTLAKSHQKGYGKKLPTEAFQVLLAAVEQRIKPKASDYTASPTSNSQRPVASPSPDVPPKNTAPAPALSQSHNAAAVSAPRPESTVAAASFVQEALTSLKGGKTSAVLDSACNLVAQSGEQARLEMLDAALAALADSTPNSIEERHLANLAWSLAIDPKQTERFSKKFEREILVLRCLAMGRNEQATVVRMMKAIGAVAGESGATSLKSVVDKLSNCSFKGALNTALAEKPSRSFSTPRLGDLPAALANSRSLCELINTGKAYEALQQLLSPNLLKEFENKPKTFEQHTNQVFSQIKTAEEARKLAGLLNSLGTKVPSKSKNAWPTLAIKIKDKQNALENANSAHNLAMLVPADSKGQESGLGLDENPESDLLGLNEFFRQAGLASASNQSSTTSLRETRHALQPRDLREMDDEDFAVDWPGTKPEDIQDRAEGAGAQPLSQRGTKQAARSLMPSVIVKDISVSNLTDPREFIETIVTSVVSAPHLWRDHLFREACTALDASFGLSYSPANVWKALLAQPFEMAKQLPNPPAAADLSQLEAGCTLASRYALSLMTPAGGLTTQVVDDFVEAANMQPSMAAFPTVYGYQLQELGRAVGRSVELNVAVITALTGGPHQAHYGALIGWFNEGVSERPKRHRSSPGVTRNPPPRPLS